MKKILVLFHSADFDGLFCREIARKFLGDQADYVGWDYGQPVPAIPEGVETIYMLDISIEELMTDKRLIWIDHHKSAIEKYFPGIPGYRIDGVAACRLAWYWFAIWNDGESKEMISKLEAKTALPSKHYFVDRMVSEPLAVRLAGEYDIWDKRDPRAELFQHGLRAQELTKEHWSFLLKDGIESMTVNSFLEKGKAIQYAKTNENAGIITDFGFTVKFEGLNFLACNAARYNSHLFAAGIKPEHDALMGFNYDGAKNEWRFSLYHAPDKEHHDLSEIAKKYGGGGHRGACGFRSKMMPLPQSAFFGL